MLKIVGSLDPSILSLPFIEQAKLYDPNHSTAWQDALLTEADGWDDEDDADVEDDLVRESNRITSTFWAQLDTRDSLKETCFWIDINIDGIQLFKVSTQSQVCMHFPVTKHEPVLTRV